MKILSDKRRFRIFNAIFESNDKISMTDLSKRVKMDRNKMSTHIALMVDYGILENQKTNDIKLSVTNETRELIRRVGAKSS